MSLVSRAGSSVELASGRLHELLRRDLVPRSLAQQPPAGVILSTQVLPDDRPGPSPSLRNLQMRVNSRVDAGVKFGLPPRFSVLWNTPDTLKHPRVFLRGHHQPADFISAVVFWPVPYAQIDTRAAVAGFHRDALVRAALQRRLRRLARKHRTDVGLDAELRWGVRGEVRGERCLLYTSPSPRD